MQEIPTTSVGERHTTGHAALQHTTELTYTDECKDEHIFDISQQMENWVLVAARLGLTAAEIEVIKYDNQSIQVKRLSTLRKWKSKALLSGTCTATYQVLLQALVDCGCNDACSILKNFVDPKLWLFVCAFVCLFICYFFCVKAINAVDAVPWSIDTIVIYSIYAWSLIMMISQVWSTNKLLLLHV